MRARRDAVRSRRLAAVRISNASVADDFADAVVYRLPMLDETQQDEMVSAFLAEVTADHVRASASALLASRVKLGAVAGASEKTSKASLRAAWTKGVASPAKPWTEVRRTVSLDLTPPAGPVTAETTVLPSPTGSGRARRFEFANGLEARDHRGSVAHGQDDPQPEACGRHVRGRSRPSRRAPPHSRCR